MYDSIMDLFQVIGFPDRGRIGKVEDYVLSENSTGFFFFQSVRVLEQKSALHLENLMFC